jgi:hypothetical protein
MSFKVNFYFFCFWVLAIFLIACADSNTDSNKENYYIEKFKDFAVIKRVEILYENNPECKDDVSTGGSFSPAHPLSQCESSFKNYQVDTSCKTTLLIELCKWKWNKKQCMENEIALYGRQVLCRKMFNSVNENDNWYDQWLEQLPEKLQEIVKKKDVENAKQAKQILEEFRIESQKRQEEREKEWQNYMDRVKKRN